MSLFYRFLPKLQIQKAKIIHDNARLYPSVGPRTDGPSKVWPTYAGSNKQLSGHPAIDQDENGAIHFSVRKQQIVGVEKYRLHREAELLHRLPVVMHPRQERTLSQYTAVYVYAKLAPQRGAELVHHLGDL